MDQKRKYACVDNKGWLEESRTLQEGVKSSDSLEGRRTAGLRKLVIKSHSTLYHTMGF